MASNPDVRIGLETSDAERELASLGRSASRAGEDVRGLGDDIKDVADSIATEAQNIGDALERGMAAPTRSIQEMIGQLKALEGQLRSSRPGDGREAMMDQYRNLLSDANASGDPSVRVARLLAPGTLEARLPSGQGNQSAAATPASTSASTSPDLVIPGRQPAVFGDVERSRLSELLEGMRAGGLDERALSEYVGLRRAGSRSGASIEGFPDINNLISSLTRTNRADVSTFGQAQLDRARVNLDSYGEGGDYRVKDRSLEQLRRAEIIAERTNNGDLAAEAARERKRLEELEPKARTARAESRGETGFRSSLARTQRLFDDLQETVAQGDRAVADGSIDGSFGPSLERKRKAAADALARTENATGGRGYRTEEVALLRGKLGDGDLLERIDRLTRASDSAGQGEGYAAKLERDFDLSRELGGIDKTMFRFNETGSTDRSVLNRADSQMIDVLYRLTELTEKYGDRESEKLDNLRVEVAKRREAIGAAREALPPGEDDGGGGGETVGRMMGNFARGGLRGIPGVGGALAAGLGGGGGGMLGGLAGVGAAGAAGMILPALGIGIAAVSAINYVEKLVNKEMQPAVQEQILSGRVGNAVGTSQNLVNLFRTDSGQTRFSDDRLLNMGYTASDAIGFLGSMGLRGGAGQIREAAIAGLGFARNTGLDESQVAAAGAQAVRVGASSIGDLPTFYSRLREAVFEGTKGGVSQSETFQAIMGSTSALAALRGGVLQGTGVMGMLQSLNSTGDRMFQGQNGADFLSNLGGGLANPSSPAMALLLQDTLFPQGKPVFKNGRAAGLTDNAARAYDGFLAQGDQYHAAAILREGAANGDGEVMQQMVSGLMKATGGNKSAALELLKAIVPQESYTRLASFIEGDPDKVLKKGVQNSENNKGASLTPGGQPQGENRDYRAAQMLELKDRELKIVNSYVWFDNLKEVALTAKDVRIQIAGAINAIDGGGRADPIPTPRIGAAVPPPNQTMTPQQRVNEALTGKQLPIKEHAAMIAGIGGLDAWMSTSEGGAYRSQMADVFLTPRDVVPADIEKGSRAKQEAWFNNLPAEQKARVQAALRAMDEAKHNKISYGAPGPHIGPSMVVPNAAFADPDFRSSVSQVAKNLKISEENLYQIMHKESQLDSRNQNPNSRASGLIQFMPKTAGGLGFTVEEIIAMKPSEQMKLVEKYLSDQKVQPGSNLAELYAAVHLPAMMGKPRDFLAYAADGTGVFPDAATNRKAYRDNRGLDTTGPKGKPDGRVTRGEIDDWVNRGQYKIPSAGATGGRTSMSGPANVGGEIRVRVSVDPLPANITARAAIAAGRGAGDAAAMQLVRRLTQVGLVATVQNPRIG
jgi:Transglycosylase SLT domain